MSLIGIYIMPHGALTLDPGRYPQFPETATVHAAARQLASEIAKQSPDVILLTTPHGIALGETYAVYLNESAEGTSEWMGEWGEFKASLTLSQEFAESLLGYLKERQEKVEGVAGFSRSVPMPIRWGETIPAWFIQSQSPSSHTKYSIFSFPLSRLTKMHSMIPDCLRIGREIFDFIKTTQAGKRVAVVVSADQSHAHRVRDGVDKKFASPFDWNDVAPVYDQKVALWASDPSKNRKVLLDDCAGMLDKAMSCGYSGCVLAQGMVDRAAEGGVAKIKGEVLCSLHPTYYGMMVAKISF